MESRVIPRRLSFGAVTAQFGKRFFYSSKAAMKEVMDLSVEVKYIAETEQEIPRFVEWLQQVVEALRKVWMQDNSPSKRNRRSRPAKIIERRP